jgi:hypothetical protein
MIVNMEDLIFLQINKIDIDKSERTLNFKQFIFRYTFLEYLVRFHPPATIR